MFVFVFEAKYSKEFSLFCLLTEIPPSYMPAHIFSLVFNIFLIPESSFAYIRRTTSGVLISCKWLPASGASLDLQPPLYELSEVQGYLHLCLWWGALALGDFMQKKKIPAVLFYEISCLLSFYGWQKRSCAPPLSSHSPSMMMLCLFVNSLYRGMLTSLPICPPPGQLPWVTKEKHPAGVEHLCCACWDSLIRPSSQTMVATSSQEKRRTSHFGSALQVNNPVKTANSVLGD